MIVKDVISSAIVTLAYEDNVLFVKFVSNNWYKYMRVPEKVFEQFLKAPSIGQFFNRFIKPVYPDAQPTNQELERVRQARLLQERLYPTPR